MEQRPIPAFYCTYLLRSILRPSLTYVGSTPDPQRRLSQHNGEVKGGAFKTSMKSKRPWEMVCIVTGFPSQMAALQFEWAWQHPHITRKIPRLYQSIAKTSRKIVTATSEKEGTLFRRPIYCLSKRLLILHILLRVNSFSRWPLDVRFLRQPVWQEWENVVAREKKEGLELKESIRIIPDFIPEATVKTTKTRKGTKQKKDKGAISSAQEPAIDLSLPTNTAAGLPGLDTTYTPLLPHLQKSTEILTASTSTTPLLCHLCQQSLPHDPPNHPAITICPHPLCEITTHITCLATHFLAHEPPPPPDANSQIHRINPITHVLPYQGSCPGCRKLTRWNDVVKPLSLRVYGREFEMKVAHERERLERKMAMVRAREEKEEMKLAKQRERKAQKEKERMEMEERKRRKEIEREERKAQKEKEKMEVEERKRRREIEREERRRMKEEELKLKGKEKEGGRNTKTRKRKIEAGGTDEIVTNPMDQIEQDGFQPPKRRGRNEIVTGRAAREKEVSDSEVEMGQEETVPLDRIGGMGNVKSNSLKELSSDSAMDNVSVPSRKTPRKRAVRATPVAIDDSPLPSDSDVDMSQDEDDILPSGKRKSTRKPIKKQKKVAAATVDDFLLPSSADIDLSQSGTTLTKRQPSRKTTTKRRRKGEAEPLTVEALLALASESGDTGSSSSGSLSSDMTSEEEDELEEMHALDGDPEEYIYPDDIEEWMWQDRHDEESNARGHYYDEDVDMGDTDTEVE